VGHTGSAAAGCAMLSSRTGNGHWVGRWANGGLHGEKKCRSGVGYAGLLMGFMRERKEKKRRRAGQGGLAARPVLVRKGKMPRACPGYRKPFLIFQTNFLFLDLNQILNRFKFEQF
jgi:hypothetical protein